MNALTSGFGGGRRAAPSAELEFTIAVSDCRFAAVENRDYVVLDQMLKTWRSNNAELKLTGALLLCDGSFVHLLEGSPRNVQRMYDRVEEDPLHENVRLLQRRPLLKRRFKTWPLAYVGPSRWVSRALKNHPLTELPGDCPEEANYLIDTILSFVGEDSSDATALSM